MRSPVNPITLTALVALIAVIGCSGTPDASGKPLILATTSIVGDLVARVAGDGAVVEVLIPVGADPHEFAPSAQQAARLRDAALVVTSGLGLEAGLADAIDAAADEGTRILELGPELDPLTLGDGDSDTPDPHWWLDPVRAARAVDLIAGRLGEVASGDWDDRAVAMAMELELLGEELRASLGTIPVERRTLITGHAAFGYFAERYGFEVIGVIVPGGATQAQTDPRALAELAGLIREEGVPAIFAETTLPTNVAEALAAEVGSEVRVVVLYTGSLGAHGTGADTYAGMMRTNVVRIMDALG